MSQMLKKMYKIRRCSWHWPGGKYDALLGWKIRENQNESAGEKRDVNHKSDEDGDDGAVGFRCRHYFIYQ